jgi:hypothetical protein
VSAPRFPSLDDGVAFADTRNAIHAYARVLGDCLKACRSQRKHWWHASLRPSLNGLTTGIVRGTTDFEIELDLRHAQLHARAENDKDFYLELKGQPAAAIAEAVGDFMFANGVGDAGLEPFANADRAKSGWQDFSPAPLESMGQVLRSVGTEMETFRASVREETSPIQLWPHHFDLSMIWLPGEKIPGQDPMNEEYSDKQMNFGFAFGDESIPEPYFYVTAYPTPDEMTAIQLPAGSEWKTDGFNGAVLTYGSLLQSSDPSSDLQDFWTRLLTAGQQHMLAARTEGKV